MPTTKVFRGHVAGFTILTASLDELQAWIDARKQDCRGHVLKLHQGVGTVSAALFSAGMPVRETVL